MNKIKCAIAAAIALTALPFSAQAQTVVDFADIASGNCAGHGATIASRGYSFSGPAGVTGFFICNPGVLASNVSAAMIEANGTSVFTFAPTDGSTFSLNSLEAGTRNQGSPRTATGFTLVGNLVGGGTVTENFALSGVTFGTFTPTGFSNLTSVTLTATGTDAQPEIVVDNINVTTAPEPAAWATLLGGLAFLGGALRRRRVIALANYSQR